VDIQQQGVSRLRGESIIRIGHDSLAFQIYRSSRIKEIMSCNYELNPVYRETLEKSGLKISGISEEEDASIIELPGHRFFIATGFVPQLLSEENRPHRLIVAFLKMGMQ
jgi:CTP synthase